MRYWSLLFVYLFISIVVSQNYLNEATSREVVKKNNIKRIVEVEESGKKSVYDFDRNGNEISVRLFTSGKSDTTFFFNKKITQLLWKRYMLQPHKRKDTVFLETIEYYPDMKVKKEGSSGKLIYSSYIDFTMFLYDSLGRLEFRINNRDSSQLVGQFVYDAKGRIATTLWKKEKGYKNHEYHFDGKGNYTGSSEMKIAEIEEEKYEYFKDRHVVTKTDKATGKLLGKTVYKYGVYGKNLKFVSVGADYADGGWMKTKYFFDKKGLLELMQGLTYERKFTYDYWEAP
ncbi:MAG: hypothetical protein IAF38_05890 [Bacteroidia bacterium]|nr:hypothetical protein [Bacteroidia bacterium]